MLRRILILATISASLAYAWAATPVPVRAEDTAAVHESASHGEDSGDVGSALNPLEWSTDLALWTAVVFLLVLVVLRVFAWKPIAEALEAREKHVRNEIEAAEKANQEAKALLEQYRNKLAEAENEVRNMLDQAKQSADETARQIVEKARQEAEAEHQRKLAEIEQAADQAVKEVAQRAGALAVELAGKIIQARLDPTADAGLIEKAVNNLGNTAGNGKD